MYGIHFFYHPLGLFGHSDHGGNSNFGTCIELFPENIHAKMFLLKKFNEYRPKIIAVIFLPICLAFIDNRLQTPILYPISPGLESLPDIAGTLQTATETTTFTRKASDNEDKCFQQANN